jgi:hypothetical protein
MDLMELGLSRIDDCVACAYIALENGMSTMESSLQSPKTLDLFSTRSDYDIGVKYRKMCDGLTIVYRVMYRT